MIRRSVSRIISEEIINLGGLVYTPTDRALELGNLAPFTIPDLSGNANVVTQESGIYKITNGTTNQLFATATDTGTDLSALGAISSITFRGRATTGTIFRFNLTSLGVSVDGSQTANNLWQDHTIDVAGVTADNFYAKTIANIGNWSDMVITGANGFAHYKMTESAAADLDGTPIFDCAGVPDAMVVEGAGIESANTIYLRDGDASGKALYRKFPIDAQEITWADGLSRWFKTGIGGTNQYFSNDDVLTPDLATTWESATPSLDPPPTVRRATWADIDAAGIDNSTVSVIYLHSTCLGCSSGSGEPDILQTAGEDFNKYYVPDARDGIATSFTASNKSINGVSLTLSSGVGYYSILIPSGLVGEDIFVSGTVNIVSGSPALTLRQYNGSGFIRTNTVVVSDGDFSFTFDTTDGSYNYFTISEADVPAEYTFSNLRIRYSDGRDYFIPESETTAGQDALGNAIENPRPNERVAHLAATDAQVRITDDASLDNLNAWGQWFYYDGADGTIVNLGGATIDVTGGVLASTGLTAATHYVGNKITAVTATTTLTAGWNYIGATFDNFSPTSDLLALRTFGHAIGYDEPKTITTFETNRLATKSEYWANWILHDGTWNDYGIWINAATWNDGE